MISSSSRASFLNAAVAGAAAGGLWGLAESLFIRSRMETITGGGDPWIVPEGFLMYAIVGICGSLLLRLLFPQKFSALALFGGILTLLVAMAALYEVNLNLLPKENFWSLKGISSSIAIWILAAIVFIYLVKWSNQAESHQPPKLILPILLALAIILSAWFSPLRDSFTSGTIEKPSSAVLSRKPNVILITLDTTRSDHLSLYGYSRSTSPVMDKWSRGGIIFDKAYSVASWTLPSHASLFTGKLPSVHGAIYTHWWLDSSEVTLAEMLSEKGYSTAGFVSGPFLLSSLNIAQGFQYYDDQLDLASGIQRLMLVKIIRRFFPLQFPWMDGQRNAKEVTDRVLSWLKKNKIQSPFFLFINYFDPHDPYQPPPPFDTLYDSGYRGPMNGVIRNLYSDRKTGERRISKGGKSLSQADYEKLKALYDGEIGFMDQQIGRLFEYLTKTGLSENTILILIGDHGESIGDHKLLDHGHTLYEEQIKIPFIITGPHVPAGKRNPNLIRNMDVMPTLLEILEYPEAAGIQGKSFSGNLDGNQIDLREHIGEIFPDPRTHVTAFKRLQKCIITVDMKWLWSSNEAYQLFNLKQDSLETNNLFPSQATAGWRLNQILFDYLKTLPQKTDLTQGPIDEATMESLKANSYIH